MGQLKVHQDAFNIFRNRPNKSLQCHANYLKQIKQICHWFSNKNLYKNFLKLFRELQLILYHDKCMFCYYGIVQLFLPVTCNDDIYSSFMLMHIIMFILMRRARPLYHQEREIIE